MASKKRQSFLPLAAVSSNPSWSGLSTGANAAVLTIETNNVQGNVYVGGIFTRIGDLIDSNRIAKWDGSAWSLVGTGLDGPVFVMKADISSNLFVAGSFGSANGISATNIAKYDISNNTWSALGSGANGSINAMVIKNDDVYIGGDFTTAGGISANRIAKWNKTTSTWSALTDVGTGQNGFNGSVYGMTFDLSGILWAVGNFALAGGKSLPYIAKWDGTTWSGFNAITFNGTPVTILADDANNIYVGGYFTTVTNSGNPAISANYIAKLTAGVWSPIVVNGVNGVDNIVNVLAYNNNKLYIGGRFTSAGDISSNYFSVYDGSSWQNLSAPFNFDIAAINFTANNEIYVSGYFNSPFNRVAKFVENVTSQIFYLPITKFYKKI